MAPQPIVIVGAGGFGREVLQFIRDVNAHEDQRWEILGFLDEQAPTGDLLTSVGAKYLGKPSHTELVRDLSPHCAFTIAIGSSVDRSTNFDLMLISGFEPVSIIHPSAWVGNTVTMGTGQVICPGSVVTTNITLGQGCQMGGVCTVGHDSILGDFVTLGPGAKISGNVRIGSFATIGSNASVIPGVTLGEGCTVGAGAAVIRDVEPGTTVVGVPAHPISGR